jgi:5'(3')-deoxyribonucleotidase
MFKGKMKFEDSHLQLILTVMAILSGFYRLVKIETTIHSKIDKLQSDFNVYVVQNTGDINLIRRDVSRILDKLDS